MAMIGFPGVGELAAVAHVTTIDAEVCDTVGARPTVNHRLADYQRGVAGPEWLLTNHPGVEMKHPQAEMKHKKDDVHGEGNYKASREFDQAEAAFVSSGRVDQAVRDAEPKSPAEAAELSRAELAARRRARDEDPALRRKSAKTRR